MMRRRSWTFLALVVAGIAHLTSSFVLNRQRAATSVTCLAAQSLVLVNETVPTRIPVRQQFNELVLFFPDEPVDAWSKAKRYLYRAKMEDASQIRRVVTFLREHFSDDVVVHILQSTPRILKKNVQTFLLPTLEFLQSFYGEELLLRALQQKPSLLLTRGFGYNQKDNFDLMETFLQLELGLTESQLRKLKTGAPAVFQLSLSQMLSALEFFRDILVRAGVADTQTVLVKLLVKHPEVYQLSTDSNLSERIEFLRGILDDKDLARILQSSSAGILGLSVEHNLRPTVEYLRERVGNDLPKCLRAHPQLLGLSLESLRRKVAFFDEIDDALAARVLIRAPAVFSLNFQDNLVPKLEFLKALWGINSSDVSGNEVLVNQLYEYPNILTLSLESNIQPTVSFFNRTGYVSLDDRWNLVEGSMVIRGRYIAASLFNRLLPRWHFFSSDEGIKDRKAPFIPLHVLVGTTDEAFCEFIDVDVEEFNIYTREAVPQLKFSSQFETWIKTGKPIDDHPS